MAKQQVDRETRKALPRWLVVAVLAVCAVVTAAAMSMSGLRGPSVAWDRANRSIEMVWAGDQAGSPPGDPRRLNGAPVSAVPVAALPGVPVIVAGAPLTHVDRGACTNCHGVITAQNAAVPAITALSTMVHEYRGVCINCHQLKVARGEVPVAGMANAPPAVVQQPAVGMGAASPKTARPPAEAEWQGLEVGPAANGIVGVNVDGAEGAARTTGLRTGDLVTSINGVPIRTMTDFVRVTDSGALAQGAVIVRRDGQRLAFELGAPRNAPPPAPLPTAIPWGANAASKTPEAQF